MAAIDVEQAVRRIETDTERVFEWRSEELRRAGFSARLAYKLALRTDIDLHRATDLVRGGCPPDLAARILV